MDPINEPDELQDHYDVLIPSSALDKALPQFDKKKRESTQLKTMIDNLSDNSKKHQRHKKLGFAEEAASALLNKATEST